MTDAGKALLAVIEARRAASKFTPLVAAFVRLRVEMTPAQLACYGEEYRTGSVGVWIGGSRDLDLIASSYTTHPNFLEFH